MQFADTSLFLGKPVRQQVALTQPLYARRAATTAQIPNFWPLVLEQAPPDIDQYIQPSDSALLLSSLTSLSVEHFEIAGGDPRSVLVRFEFAPNEYFADTVLEKRFWYRRARDDWAGLVSEPVPIAWKKDRDLTGGLLDMVCRAWKKEQEEVGAGAAAGNDKKKEKKPLSEEQKALKKKIENTGMGGLSFFAWFGFIGRRISAKESAEATTLERERREKKLPLEPPADEEGEDDEDEFELDMSLEIFPDGDDLAVAITDDLWPGAIKYFSTYFNLTPHHVFLAMLCSNIITAQAQEQDALSDADFESDNDEQDDGAVGSGSSAASDDEPPAKKQKSA